MEIIGSGLSYAGYGLVRTLTIPWGTALFNVLSLAFLICYSIHGNDLFFSLAYRFLRFLKRVFGFGIEELKKFTPGFLDPVLDFIKNLGERVFDAIENALRGVQKGIQGALDYLKELVGPLLRNAISAFIVAYFLLRRR